MSFYEKIIHFQNQAEKNFEEKKNISTGFKFFLAFVTFMASTIFAGLTMPVRMLFKSKKNRPKGIIDLNKDNFEEVKQEPLVLLDFWTEWCGPCLLMNDSIKAFSSNNNHIIIGKVNADLNSKILKSYKVKGLPQFILLQNGQEVRRHAGSMTQTELQQFVKV